MRKRLSFLGLLLALCVTNAFSQTLLYEASGSGETFGKSAGSMDYELTLGGNSVVDGKVVMTAGNTAANIVLDPAINPTVAGGGLTVLMKVADVDVTKGGQFMALGSTGTDMLGGLKIKSDGTDGLFHATYQNAQWAHASGNMTGRFPTNGSTAVVGYGYLRTNYGGAGSAFYLNGVLSQSISGLQTNATVGNVTFGGLRRDDATYLNEGMQIEMVRIYEGNLTAEEVYAATVDMIGGPFETTLESDGNGVVEFDGEGVVTLPVVNALTQLTIVATPNEDYIFDKWVDAADETRVISTEASYTFPATSAIAYKAIFTEYAERTITVSSTANGTTSLTGTSVQVKNSQLSITAAADLGYAFQNWVNGDDETEVISTANPYIFTVENDLNIKAVFVQSTVDLQVVTPAADDEQWYYIQSQRNSGGGPWWSLAAGETGYAVPGAMNLADNQKFTLISAGEGKVTFKSFDGRIMTSNGSFVAEGELPATAWTLTSNVVDGVQGFLFPGENSGLHQGGSSWSWEVRAAGWYQVGDNCTFFFYPATQDTELRLLYNDVLDMYEGSLAGTTVGGVGNFATAEIKAAQEAALQTALEVSASQFGAADDVVEAAIANLEAAVEAFNASKVQLLTSSADAPEWYFIKHAGASYAMDMVIYTRGEGLQCMWGTASPLANTKLLVSAKA